MEARRRSDGHNEPAVQVVGFHVEGQASSPSPATSILQDSLRKISTGSPTPVIIPPQFQREPSATRTVTDSHRSLDFGAAQPAAGQPTASATAGSAAPSSAAAPTAKPGAAAAPSSAAAPAADGTSCAAAAASGAAGSSGAAAGGRAAPAVSTSGGAAAAPAPRDAAVAKGPGGGKGGGRPPLASSADGSASGKGGSGSAQSSGGGAADGAGAGGGGQQQRGAPPDVPPKKPATRAERRAIQEASRAAKAARLAGAAGGGGSGGGSGGGGGGSGGGAADAGGAAAAAAAPSKGGGGERPPSRAASSAPAPAGAAGGAGAPSDAAAAPAADHHRGRHGRGHHGHGAGSSAGLFAHLQQYKRVTVESVLQQKETASMHPAIVALALQYADGSITGGTARCVAMLHALAQVISDYKTPPGKALTRDLMAQVNSAVDFLVRGRPLGVSMGNAIKFLKLCISKADPNAPESSAKSHLLKQLGDFIQEKVVLADQVLASNAVSKVYDGDVVMTYSYSQLVLEVLLRAHAAGRRFRVVVVDSRPECEGRQLLRRLLEADVACSYTLLSGLSYAIKEVTKVLLGAAAVLSNGTVMSRAGSACVAMTASAAGKPVMVACETLKFHERVQLDSITHNELGDPGALALLPPGAKAAAPVGDDKAAAAAPAGDGCGAVTSPPLASWESVPRLGLLNLKYDAMPADYVTMIVTEFGMVPPSSVPVILREWGAKMEEGQ